MTQSSLNMPPAVISWGFVFPGPPLQYQDAPLLAGDEIAAPPAFSYNLVPPIYSHDEALLELDSAADLAIAEAHELASFDKDFCYPKFPSLTTRVGKTTFGLSQLLRAKLLGCFNDVREMRGADMYLSGSSLGPLNLAVNRALLRNSFRLSQSPPSLLEIGAGHRRVARGLKALHGDAIKTYESSPTYSEEPGIDVELPAAPIDHAHLPTETFELIYSIFGSYYGKDQLHVLQKVADSLLIGGEALLMWSTGKFLWSQNDKLAWLAREHQAFFQKGGLDITAQLTRFGRFRMTQEEMYLVWIRKRANDVNVMALFEGAKELTGSQNIAPTVRLSLEGPYLPESVFTYETLNSIVRQMVESAIGVYGIEPTILEKKLLGTRAQTVSKRSTAVALDNVAEYIMNIILFHRLDTEAPLSVQVIEQLQLDRVLALLRTDTTIPIQDRLIYSIVNYHRF